MKVLQLKCAEQMKVFRVQRVMRRGPSNHTERAFRMFKPSSSTAEPALRRLPVILRVTAFVLRRVSFIGRLNGGLVERFCMLQLSNNLSLQYRSQVGQY